MTARAVRYLLAFAVGVAALAAISRGLAVWADASGGEAAILGVLTTHLPWEGRA